MAALSGLIFQRLSECSSFSFAKYAEGRTFLEKDDILPVPVSAVMHTYLRFA